MRLREAPGEVVGGRSFRRVLRRAIGPVSAAKGNGNDSPSPARHLFRTLRHGTALDPATVKYPSIPFDAMTTALTSYRLSHDVCLGLLEAGPDAAVSPESPALTVMTDLAQVAAAMTHPDAALTEAETRMEDHKVQMLFVSDNPPSVQGVVTLATLHGDKPMQLVHERGVHFDELRVADVMSHLHELHAVSYDDMLNAKVRDVVDLLTRCAGTHLLVLTRTRIRGVVSRNRVQRALGQTVPALPPSHSFAALARALA